MTCRHRAGDPDCSANQRVEYRDKIVYRDREPETPDSEKYEIVEAERVGNHLVLKVLYPNCAKCSYEGNKVMVFLNVTETEALRWRKIDPHFRLPPTKATEAPSPAARFPASDEGWWDALSYARSKG